MVVPLIMEKHKLHEVIADKMQLFLNKRAGKKWPDLLKRISAAKPKITVALVGKYTTMLDTYASVVEALKAASWLAGYDLNLRWVDAEDIERGQAETHLHDAAGIVVPGGFGSRGIEGKITAIQYAREHKIPYLGLCLGMQLAVIEFARNVAGIAQATSQEFLEEREEKNAPAQRNSAAAERSCVIHIMADQKTITDKGGTMRLGGWDCRLTPGTFAFDAYAAVFEKDSPFSHMASRPAEALAKVGRGKDRIIRERHRHRYEFN